MADNSEDIQKALSRAKRLKVLRSMSGLTMQAFAEKCNIGQTTVNYWENSFSVKGLTERGARKVIEALKNEGILSSLMWLMEGIGEPPKIIDQHKLTKLPVMLPEKKLTLNLNKEYAISLNSKLKQEIELFQKIYPLSIICTINDDSMIPIYVRGDIVGGVYISDTPLSSLEGRDCIIEKENGMILVRRVKLGLHPNTYSIYGINHDISLEYPPEINIKIKKIALIVRVWKEI